MNTEKLEHYFPPPPPEMEGRDLILSEGKKSSGKLNIHTSYCIFLQEYRTHLDMDAVT